MPARTYKNGAWEDASFMRNYVNGAWEDKEYMRGFANNAWVEKWRMIYPLTYTAINGSSISKNKMYYYCNGGANSNSSVKVSLPVTTNTKTVSYYFKGTMTVDAMSGQTITSTIRNSIKFVPAINIVGGTGSNIPFVGESQINSGYSYSMTPTNKFSSVTFSFVVQGPTTAIKGITLNFSEFYVIMDGVKYGIV